MPNEIMTSTTISSCTAPALSPGHPGWVWYTLKKCNSCLDVQHPTENLDWPKYSKANHTYMNIDVGTRNELGTGPHLENCNLLRNHFGF
ncbi:hypothetical protein TNIN_204351 [Trichonephila inaurata madagascariensis]|uniref:Uncharacterized protein n=1 Tax=Trichonephila inaurata madagascariensis TaxID=2747483 RepID=A0A8X6WPL8_9ARAC|nr:hypothetical protein TNIN_204351 [Trichonephila inaurata madagascariensis]